jgi:CHAT domain-containing protein
LIQPIADMLPPDPEARIIFVPQDSLFLVPFAALQDPMGTYLVERHTISVTPSIQTLAFTHRQGQVHRAVESPAEAALIIGNPSMPNYVVSPDQAPQPLPALPGAEEEAKGIAAFLHTEPLTGSQATKAAFLSRVSQATLIHLATHGLLDPDYKDDLRSAGGFARIGRLFGTILAKSADPVRQIHMPGALALAPANGDSGLLTSDEIARLKTHAAHVVLSACDTGRGVISDDGVIGLSRAWIVAGVPTVIVSLWSVPDAPTSALMLEFYRQLAQGADKAQALRRAMLTILQHHPDPLDWAAFTLVGEAA